MSESLNENERKELNNEMAAFAFDLVTEMLGDAIEARRLRGTERTESTSFKGSVDGIGYNVFIAPDEKEVF